MSVGLLNPNNRNPDETHQYDDGVWIRVGDIWGKVIVRGYTYTNDIPTYAYHGEDNIIRSATEREIDEVET